MDHALKVEPTLDSTCRRHTCDALLCRPQLVMLNRRRELSRREQTICLRDDDLHNRTRRAGLKDFEPPSRAQPRIRRRGSGGQARREEEWPLVMNGCCAAAYSGWPLKSQLKERREASLPVRPRLLALDAQH